MDDKDEGKPVEFEVKETNAQDNVVMESLDDALPYVGELGKYQVMIISIMALILLVTGFPFLIMVFLVTTPHGSVRQIALFAN